MPDDENLELIFFGLKANSKGLHDKGEGLYIERIWLQFAINYELHRIVVFVEEK